MVAAISVKVSCYAGYKGEETPRSFSIKERKVVVDAVLDRWLAPDHRHFKVRGDDGDLYILRHDVKSGQWELALYERQQPEAAED